MIAFIHIQEQIPITKTVAMAIDKHVQVNPEQLANALRSYVALHHKGDDAGVDYFYNPRTGLIHLAGEEDWVLRASQTNPSLYKLLEAADVLDGRDFSTTIEPDK